MERSHPALPSVFVPLAGLPRTGNGKLDRRVLPAPRPALGEIGAEGGAVAPPLGPRKRSYPRSGRRCSASSGVELPVRSLFEAPTVAGLAVTVVKELARQAGVDGCSDGS